MAKPFKYVFVNVSSNRFLVNFLQERKRRKKETFPKPELRRIVNSLKTFSGKELIRVNRF